MPPGIPYPVKGFAPREKKANGSRRLRFGVPGLQPGFPASCGNFVFIIDNRSAFCQAAPRQPEKTGRRGAVNCISTVSPSGLRLRDVRDRRREGRAFYEKLSAVEPQLEGKPFFCLPQKLLRQSFACTPHRFGAAMLRDGRRKQRSHPPGKHVPGKKSLRGLSFLPGEKRGVAGGHISLSPAQTPARTPRPPAQAQTDSDPAPRRQYSRSDSWEAKGGARRSARRRAPWRG